VYGDCRPMHRIAIETLRPRGVRVHVFEEGYLRPNWVTCEPDGVNGYSRFLPPRPSDDAGTEAPGCGADAQPALPPRPWTRAGYCLRYCAGNLAFRPVLRHYRTHRPLSLSREAIGWVDRGIRLRLAGDQTRRRLERICDGAGPLFLLPLQLDSDTQIQVHSRFRDMGEVIELVSRSFAKHAPEDAILVVKAHPLDNGVTDYARVVAATRAALGLGERLAYVDGGHLPSLLKRARGVVVVNSTAGLQAIHHNCPTKLLGTAIYDYPALVDRQSLSGFWRNPMPPDDRTYRQFRSALIAYCQFPGSYFSAEGIAALLPAVTRRLAGGDCVPAAAAPIAAADPAQRFAPWPAWPTMPPVAALGPANDVAFGP
jgi:capsular polysaccharide export protein